MQDNVVRPEREPQLSGSPTTNGSCSGGDGFVSLAADRRTVYTEWQNGSIVRVDRRTNERTTIKPEAAEGEPRLRWNWNAPLIMSPHDPKTLYIGAQEVFLSPDRGNSWEAISPALTGGGDRDTLSLMGVAARDFTLAKNDGVSAWPTLFQSPSHRCGLACCTPAATTAWCT